MIDEQMKKFEALIEKQKVLEEKKIRLEEQYNSKKEALIELVEEIKNAGYNPKELNSIIEQKEKELIEEISKLETALTELSNKITEIES